MPRPVCIYRDCYPSHQPLPAEHAVAMCSVLVTTTTCTNEVHCRATTSLITLATYNRVCSHTAPISVVSPVSYRACSRAATSFQLASHLCQPNSQPPRPATGLTTYNRAYSHTATNNNRRSASHFQLVSVARATLFQRSLQP